MFKARLASEADGDDLEERYITACYIVMENFGYTIEELKRMPATTFHILLDEMKKKAIREKEALKSSKKFR